MAGTVDVNVTWTVCSPDALSAIKGSENTDSGEVTMIFWWGVGGEAVCVAVDESLREILWVVLKPVIFGDISTSAVCRFATGLLDDTRADGRGYGIDWLTEVVQGNLVLGMECEVITYPWGCALAKMPFPLLPGEDELWEVVVIWPWPLGGRRNLRKQLYNRMRILKGKEFAGSVSF